MNARDRAFNSLLCVGFPLCALSGVRMTHVPYKGVADGYPAVMSGEVKWILGSPISALPLMKAGRLRGIAVLRRGAVRHFPTSPPSPRAACPGTTSRHGSRSSRRHALRPKSWRSCTRRARTALLDREVVRRMEAEATEVVGSAPAQEVRREHEKWRELVGRSGLKVQ